MLHTFRRFFSSTIGIGLTLALVIVIALAFAAADVAGTGGSSILGGGDRVAKVGDGKVTTTDLSRALTQSVEAAKRQDPKATMKAFLASGGLAQTLDGLIDRTAIAEFGKAHGMVAGKRLVDSELTKIPGLQGLDGKFSEATYRQLLAQQQLTDAAVRADLAQGLIARQVLTPAQYGGTVAGDLALRYAALLKERRTGTIAMLPSIAFAPRTPPSDAEVAAYYAAHQQAFIRPERRTIRWASFDSSAVKSIPTPTEAEIAARYEANKAQYQASELRKLTRLVVPTEAAAQAILDEVAKGKSLDEAARSKGLTTSSLGPLAKPAVSDQTAPAVADAAFAAARGKLVGPVKGALGWELVRVDAVEAHPAKSLEQAHGEILAQLTEARRRDAFAKFAARIEDQFDKGGALSDAAREAGVTLQETPPLTADGQVYGQPGKTAPKELARVVQAAFAMERESAPQVAEIDPGNMYVIFDVSRIVASAPAPLAEIRQDVVAVMQTEKGYTAAKAAGLKLIAQTKAGKDLAAAIATLGVPLPPVTPISMDRQQLTAGGRNIPPALGLMFSMAQGTTKLLPGPRNGGWLVVSLKSIEPGAVSGPGDPTVASTAQELGQLAANEYVEELRNAIRAEVGVTRNETAIKAVVAQATGGQ